MPSAFRRITRVAGAVALCASLAGCLGYPGAYPGGGYGAPGGYGHPDRGYGAQLVSGRVESFDPSSGRLLLAGQGGYGGYGGYGGATEVWVDRGTRLFYRGREHDVAGLERGDIVRIDVEDDGRRLWARGIEVTQNVREGGYAPGGTGGSFEGAVRFVDPGRRLIEVTRGGYAGRVERVWYDDRTRFDYRGQPASPAQLEAGDVVRIEARPSGNGWLATWVSVTVDARSR